MTDFTSPNLERGDISSRQRPMTIIPSTPQPSPSSTFPKQNSVYEKEPRLKWARWAGNQGESYFEQVCIPLRRLRRRNGVLAGDAGNAEVGSGRRIRAPFSGHAADARAGGRAR